jgi:2-(1,2-epoxy-1,2-dihydrophenyl)acetyl-CoA isomerase
VDVLTYEVVDGVAEITMQRPDRLNALDDGLIDALTVAFTRAATDASARAVLLTGAGRGFCAGADLKFMMERALGGLTEPPETLFWRVAGRMHEGMAALKRMRKPTIAAVNGPCAGAGVGYALACDVVWASREATFRLAYTNIGLAPDGGTTYHVVRLLGEKRALELFYSAEKVGAEDALRLGFCTRVLEPDALLPEARAFARRLARGPGMAFGLAKSLVNDALREGFETQMERERAAIAQTSTSEDFMEGVSAFLAKRDPEFKGR